MSVIHIDMVIDKNKLAGRQAGRQHQWMELIMHMEIVQRYNVSLYQRNTASPVVVRLELI